MCGFFFQRGKKGEVPGKADMSTFPGPLLPNPGGRHRHRAANELTNVPSPNKAQFFAAQAFSDIPPLDRRAWNPRIADKSAGCPFFFFFFLFCRPTERRQPRSAPSGPLSKATDSDASTDRNAWVSSWTARNDRWTVQLAPGNYRRRIAAKFQHSAPAQTPRWRHCLTQPKPAVLGRAAGPANLLRG